MATYAYDGNAKRVKTVLANGSTEYVFYDLSGKLRCALKGTAKIDYFDLDGQPFVERNSAGKDVATGTAPLKTTYLHPDWIGSPRMATDFSGTVRWREHFDPYGKKLNGVAEKRGFTGHSFDPETGLTYMLARYYDAEVGRFLQTDPIGSKDDLNLYAYVKNDPLNGTDPMGLSCEKTTGSNICNTPPKSADGTTSGKPQVTGTAGHDKASQNIAQKMQNVAMENGETVDKTTYNRSADKATDGAVPSNKRPDAIFESTAPDGSKVVRMGEAVSPSQTVEGQVQKLENMAKGASKGVKVEVFASRFAKVTGKLLPAAGAIAIGVPLATDPDYHADEAFADFFGIEGAH